MADITTFLLKRRVSGAAGAPSTLKSGEAAINMSDGVLYVGVGDDGAGNATQVLAFAKVGFDPASLLPPGGGAGQALVKSGTGDFAVAWQTVSTGGTTYTEGAGIDITGSVISVDYTVVLPKTDAALLGTPTAPTAAPGTNTQQLATTAYVQAALSALAGAAPEMLDTISELAAAINNDPNFATTLETALTGKLSKAENLNDLPDKPTARGNLGLGDLATRNATELGTLLDGVTIDGGTF